MEKRETQDQSGYIKRDEMEGRWYPGTALRAEGGMAGLVDNIECAVLPSPLGL